MGEERAPQRGYRDECGREGVFPQLGTGFVRALETRVRRHRGLRRHETQPQAGGQRKPDSGDQLPRGCDVWLESADSILRSKDHHWCNLRCNPRHQYAGNRGIQSFPPYSFLWVPELSVQVLHRTEHLPWAGRGDLGKHPCRQRVQNSTGGQRPWRPRWRDWRTFGHPQRQGVVRRVPAGDWRQDEHHGCAGV